jgi:hypothetical protein
MAKPITLTLVMAIRPEDFDTDTLQWVEELKEKAMEQGEVMSCTLANFPATIDLA